MNIAIYSPYLDTASGGEKYMLTIAECLSRREKVDVLLDARLEKIGGSELREKNEKWHGLDLSKVEFIPGAVGEGVGVLEKLLFFRRYDWLFYNSDGSFFLSSAKKNILHFQLPVDIQKGLISSIKLMSWKGAIYNSKFTQEYISRQYNLPGWVVYPPVDIEKLKVGKKKKQILNVGRFVKYQNPKKQDVMVEAFKELVKTYELSDWSLHLAGGLMEGNEDYLEGLKKMAGTEKIFFYPNISHSELVKLYSESVIYWHAMGFGESDPKRDEHFGISTVEAMASGCVPVVINKGGQIEIVGAGESGLLWGTIEELIGLTKKLIDDPEKQKKLSLNATLRAKEFSKDKFVKKVEELVYGR